ncbi:MAG: sugar ABC transporter permease [Acidisphaera sp.]|nr:sugar ABC transporter permease [Acidisphaera sp.]MBV9813865.1 sugar ABC transporter permease [Acetobacteraceae bacterium]
MSGASATVENAPPQTNLAAATTTGAGVGRPSISNALFVLPYLLALIVLLIVPLGLGIWLSFQDYDMLGGWNGGVGWDNYRNLLDDNIFRGAVWNTIRFVLMTAPAFVAIGLFLAVALNDRTRRSAMLRSVFFGASVLSVTIVTLIWRLVYLPDRGLLSDVLALVGLHTIDPVVNETWALPAIAVVTVWWIIGLPMTLFLAALQQVPPELYEAAALDRSSRWRTFLFITLPSIRRTIVVVAVLEVILQFQLFGQALLITGGGPNNTSRPIVQFIYESGFRDLQIGFASAASQILFLLMLIATLAQAWVARRRDAA